MIDEEDIRKAAPESTESVEIEAFVERVEIDPMYFEKPYYLVPGKKAEKGYVLLREVLAKTGKIGIARVVIRTRQYLAALSPRGDALMVDLMRFPQEIVKPDEFTLPKATARAIASRRRKSRWRRRRQRASRRHASGAVVAPRAAKRPRRHHFLLRSSVRRLRLHSARLREESYSTAFSE